MSVFTRLSPPLSLLLVLLFPVLGFQSRAFTMNYIPSLFLKMFFKTESCLVVQVGFEFTAIILPQLPEG